MPTTGANNTEKYATLFLGYVAVKVVILIFGRVAAYLGHQERENDSGYLYLCLYLCQQKSGQSLTENLSRPVPACPYRIHLRLHNKRQTEDISAKSSRGFSCTLLLQR